MNSVHRSPFCGAWYPASAGELSRLLEKLEQTSEQRTGTVQFPGAVAFVVPHAGLAYSGAVAQAAYRLVEQLQPRRIFLLGFSHSGGPAMVATTDVDEYATPLGDIPVCREPLPFPRLREKMLCDHSIEIQLPLVRAHAPQAEVVPLYVGQLSDSAREQAADALAGLYRPGDVLIASSDFTHYGKYFGYEPFPLDSCTPDRLTELDTRLMEAVGSLDTRLFGAELRETGATVCGRDPVALLLETLRRLPVGEVFQLTLDYQTSGQLTGDFSHSVSYVALGYFPATSFSLAGEDAAALLACARATLEAVARSGGRTPVIPPAPPPALQRKMDAFVTLYRRGELCGCMGRIGSDEPLFRLIPELTISAALDDPRFAHPRLEPAEMELEISLLTPLKRLRNLDEFRLHQHGAMLVRGSRRAVLLPQVVQEYRLTRNQFLAALARKAGLEWTSLDEYARLYVFRTTRIPSPAEPAH